MEIDPIRRNIDNTPMTRVQVILSCAALASLTLGPGLCLNGLLAHPCESGHEAPCHHETDCTSDPCNVVFVRPEAVTRLDAPSELMAPLLWSGVTALVSNAVLVDMRPLDGSPPPDVPALLACIVLLI